jgi:hypothetical protein
MSPWLRENAISSVIRGPKFLYHFWRKMIGKSYSADRKARRCEMAANDGFNVITSQRVMIGSTDVREKSQIDHGASTGDENEPGLSISTALHQLPRPADVAETQGERSILTRSDAHTH